MESRVPHATARDHAELKHSEPVCSQRVGCHNPHHCQKMSNMSKVLHLCFLIVRRLLLETGGGDSVPFLAWQLKHCVKTSAGRTK